jgi:hypothetical protein
MRVQIICPRCHKHSTIRGNQKKIEYDPKIMNPMMRHIMFYASSPRDFVHATFGRISIEAFECAWEIGDAKHVTGALHTGASLCRLRLVIEDNRAMEL